MRVTLLLLLLFVAVSLNPATVLALDLGQNITIYDENGYYGSGVGYEDGETEPGMVNSQIWDLEGFFLKQNSLSMVGGYNFRDGAGNPLYTSGDIFISTGVAPAYEHKHKSSDGNQLVTKTYGYEYVLDLTFNGDSGGTYSVFSLGSDAILETAYYKQNEGSSPWKYESGGTLTDFSGTFLFSTVTDTGFVGGTHYALTGFDLSFLGHGTDFYAHFTMECGNDNLMGKGTVVPEPSTFLLFAAGGGLLWLTGRRKRK